MNWLDSQTREMLQKEATPKLAPPKVPEFALVLLQDGSEWKRLIRAIRRINDCEEAEAVQMALQRNPVTINTDLSEEAALSGQFELICCDAISVFVRSEVLAEGDQNYLQSLFRQILQSSEFRLARVQVKNVPLTESGQKFADQFLGIVPQKPGDLTFPFGMEVPFKKARIMKHWASRVGAEVECDAFQPESS